MKITVLSGSPKGKYSVTLQSVRYLQKHLKEVEFNIVHIGQRIKALERNEEKFMEIIASIEASDGVIWAYPVYTFLVPYQVMRFCELVFERKMEKVFQGKYCSQILTSKHFFDYTAYNYIHQISEDLKMKHIHGLCADMDDLTKEEGRIELLSFGKRYVETIKKQLPVAKKYRDYEAYCKTERHSYEDEPSAKIQKKGKLDYKIVILTDCMEEDKNLRRMIDVYKSYLPYEATEINLNDIKMQGGCLSCFQCAFEGKCVYNDGFDDFHRKTIVEADCVIMAASIKRHWFSSRWKCYDDRQFYNGHRTSTMGKSTGYIISGDLRNEPNLREVLEARSEVGELYLIDIITDEYNTDEEITNLLKTMAKKTSYAVEKKPHRPRNFYGVGGMKIFRDLIYVMGGLMQEDHRFYKKNGLYDFPHKQVGRRMQMKLVGLMLKSEKVRSQMGKYMNEGMLKQYDKIIDEK